MMAVLHMREDFMSTTERCLLQQDVAVRRSEPKTGLKPTRRCSRRSFEGVVFFNRAPRGLACASGRDQAMADGSN